MDELPMIYGTCVFLYSLHQHAKPKHEKNGFYIFIMSVISITVTVVYLLWPNPIFHQTSYATLVFVLIYEAIIAWTNFPQIKHIAFTSLGFYICGFIFWSIDNALCSNLRTMRSDSEPYSLIRASTQLHAWWHIFTGYATYLHILLSTYARQLYLKRSCSYKKLCGVWPYIEIGSKE